MGYSEESKAYRLYDLTTNKVFVSRDVKFDEHSQLTTTTTSPILERSEDYIDKDNVCITNTNETIMLLISHYLQVVIMKKMFLQLDKRHKVLKKYMGKAQRSKEEWLCSYGKSIASK